ncbi:MAG: TIGR04219 family outer membrane beta-barrel protein [Pseudomonadota bacterium]
MDDQPSRAFRRAPVSCACALVTSALLAAPATADIEFGMYAGGGAWMQDISGSATSGADNLDLVDDLGFADKSNNYFYGAFEHPIPLLPNVRIEHTSLAQTGEGVLNRSIEFNGETFNLAAELNSEIDISQTDALLYWGLLDTVVDLDVGVGVRFLDGFVMVRDETTFTNSTAEFDTPVPMVYGAARADLPFSGFWVGASARGLAYEDNSLIDIDARVGWTSPIGLGLEVGYRQMDLDVEELDEIDVANVMIKGPFAALNYDF